MNADPPSIRTGLVILAAGSSSRLGRPKQLLGTGDSHLLGKLMQEAAQVPFHKKVLVLGAFSETLQKNISPSSFSLVTNDRWREGMGSSVGVGMACLLEKTTLDQVIVSVCDQPFLDAEQLTALLQCGLETDKGIVASTYGESFGVPVLFKKQYFPHLLALTGKGGAKQLIHKFNEDVTHVRFPLGHIDIDTEADYQAFLANDRPYFLEKSSSHKPPD
ncbi:CTP:molybdopterin cytidylyltransferase [Lunatimonas lonarensis]|uniref:CTP:molybdopterin cytidylyltransferase n=1 Tax=Lunatimonas lonarensis TaxID=1232681 RepID=R7ZR17_9BACT|nr:nucleotidyltransferase family protein [Lunatimonas lonarensis]EON76459.1 CTP:molybdopterin cytidylyltransferase [Lunatimonas lonarensis]